MSKQEVIISRHFEEDMNRILNQYKPDKLFILTDEHTHHLCAPRLKGNALIANAIEISIGAEDVNKTLESLAYVWKALSEKGATRHSFMINLGGGMVSDLGGFAASTFKRGFSYINVPTTLLGMVDAAVGGKTGINFNGFKNEIGTFAPAAAVLIDTQFLRTLDYPNFISGYAEMLKHGLISNENHWSELLRFETKDIDYTHLSRLVAESVQVKKDIVEQDPFEHGIRKALNLGHTVGHAFESLALEENRPILHGYAVAWGMVCELYLSHIKRGFPLTKMRQTIDFIKENYEPLYIDCNHYERLYTLMQHDKKNVSDTINFTLLEDIGQICINQTTGKKLIFEMFDFYREAIGE